MNRLSLWLCTIFLLVFLSSSYAKTVDVRELKKLLEIGNMYCGISNFERGIKKYTEAFEKFNSPDAAYNLGITYEIDVRNKTKALYYYKRFLELERESVYSSNVRRWINELTAELKKERKKDPMGGDDNESREQKERKKASAYPKKDSIAPKRVRTLKKLANKEILGRNYKKGVKIYKDLYDNYSDPDAAYNLGFVYHHYLHNYEDASFYYRKFLELEPFSSDAERVKSWLKQVEKRMIQ